MASSTMTMKSCEKAAIFLTVFFLMLGEANGAVVVPLQPGNQLTAFVDVNVTFDIASGFYVYNYSVTNASSSLQEIWFFSVEFNGTVLSGSAPEGWSFELHEDRPIVSWAATEVVIPLGFVDGGNIVPSPFQIKPGQTLTGFILRSPDPPGSVNFFAQGFTKLPQVETDVGELPLEGEEIPDFTEDSFISVTSGPVSIVGIAPFRGGRRPAVDGFLVFLNISNRQSLTAPVSIIIKFSFSGETVDRTTFRATLNGVDVTPAFVSGGPGDLVAVFDIPSSPLKLGRNVLLTSVEGIVPGTIRTAADVDRLTFFVTAAH